MTKSDKVRRLMAKAKINGVEEEKLIKQVMKSCEFTRGLAVTYIRKNKNSAALREVIKAMREKLAGTTADTKVKVIETAARRPGRPRKAEVVVEKTAARRPGRPRKTVEPAVETPAPVVETPVVVGPWPFPNVAIAA